MPPWLRRPSGALIVTIVALAYVEWLGSQWLPLSYTSAEMPLSTGRVWDMRQELARSGGFAWWTPTYLNGSSTVPQQNFFLFFPWVFLVPLFGLMEAGKLLALAFIGVSGLTMYFCARHLLRSEHASIVAALAYLLHSHLIQVTTWSEQPVITVFVSLLPLAWLTFVRVLEEGRFRDAFACAATLTLLLWSHSKLTTVEIPFLAAFALWSLRRSPDRRAVTLRALGLTGGLTLLLALPFIVPPLMEVKLFKLFEGDPFAAWQRLYRVHSLGDLVNRTAGARNYLGNVLLALIIAAVAWPKVRSHRSLFWLLVAFEVAGIALGHGPESVGAAAVRTLIGDNDNWTYATYWTCECAFFVAAVGVGAATLRARIASLDARVGAVLALGAFWFVPWFSLLATVPLYSQIRAPEIFFGEPCAFFGALLAGFFIRDVVEPRLEGWGERTRWWVVAALATAFFFDGWPMQGRTMASDISPVAIGRARGMYARIGKEAQREGGKVYDVNTNAIYLAGPSWGGPPMLREFGLQFGAPRGSGRLDAAADGSFELNQAYFELAGPHWIVFDKSWGSGHIPAYRAAFPTEYEDDIYAVFHVTTARPYVSGYTRTALAFGDPPHLPELALWLANAGYLLVQATEPRIDDASVADLAGYTMIYVPSPPGSALPSDVASKVVVVGERPAELPPREPHDDALADLVVTRPGGERIEAQFTARSACVAVVQESYYPYWRAMLDGNPTEVRRVAYGLMGVPVTEGPHSLVLEYQVPRAYGLSIMVSAGTFLAGLGGSFRRRRAGPPS